MADPFIGEIRPIGFNFAPHGWAFCAGQILSIAQNQALFSLLGTTFGGNGTTTFALPDLRGRLPIGWGQGPGLANYALGEVAGSTSVTLTLNQMSTHSHRVNASGTGVSTSPVGHLPAVQGGSLLYGAPGADSLAADTIVPTGGSQPHENRQPYLGLNYIIALSGIFPTRP